MASVHHFKTAEGDSLIPVADGVFVTDNISADNGRGNCFLAFYDTDGETLITPTAGTITFESAAIEGQWLDAGAGGSISAINVGTAYTPPSFDSMVIKSRMTLSGITGASFVRAFHWRDD